MNTPTTTPTDPTPTAAHHARLDSFLSVLERLGVIALTLAPAIAAPFVKNPQSQAILAAEAPIANQLAGVLAASISTDK